MTSAFNGSKYVYSTVSSFDEFTEDVLKIISVPSEVFYDFAKLSSTHQQIVLRVRDKLGLSDE